MGSEPGTIFLGVEAFDKRDFVGSLVSEVPPLVARIVADAVRAARAVRIDEVHGHEVVRGEVAPVGDRERLVCHGVVNRPPDVDDAHARLQETVRLLGKVVFDALDAGLVRLVDVDAFLGRTSEHWISSGHGEKLTTGPRF